MTRMVLLAVVNRESANAVPKVTTLRFSNPGSTLCSAISDRASNIDAITSVFATATSVTSNTVLARVW